MSQKLTLARYLEGRGSVKSLTRIEAEAFGVPYPLVSGWPARYGAVEITDAMLEDLATRVASASRSTANKARRGLEGVGVGKPVAFGQVMKQPLEVVREAAPQSDFGRAVPSFVMRRARRYCMRRPTP